jgi:hypothetical protein
MTTLRSLALSLLLLLLTSCAPTLKMEQHTNLGLEIAEGDFPATVAILPFANDTKEHGLDVAVRRAFANHFSAKNYRDMKLPLVDEKLLLFQKSSGKTVAETPPAELARVAGCDGLLFGRVTDYQWIYAGVYSRIGVEAEVWMVNAKSGKELFRMREAVRYHEGGIPATPLSAVVTVVSTALNLRDIQKVRLVNELAYKFMAKLPSPRSLAETGQRPVIYEVLTNGAEGPFIPRKVIRVAMRGEPGLVGSFDIGAFRRGVPLREEKPGIYVGEYTVLPGDNAADMPIIVTLSRLGGLENQWTDISGFVTVDTTPPPRVAGLRAKGFPDRVELVWDGLKDISDLRGYRVLRSDKPLSGFREIAFVESPNFSDTTAVPGSDFHYRIVASDQAGNDADPTDSLRARLSSRDPVPLSGTLSKDTVLEGTYLVNGTVVTPAGVTLTIQPETRLLFTEGRGMVIRGKLVINGGETAVQLLPAQGGKWSGVTVDGGQAELGGFRLQGALNGLVVKDADARILRGVMSGCDTGIEITGNGAVELRETTLSGNRVGLRMSRSIATVSGNTIVQNDTGVELAFFSGKLEGNNVFDNGINLAAPAEQRVGVNYLGSVRREEMRLKRVTVERVYDARLPGGREVVPEDNPYLRLSFEERQRKQAEIIAEAGEYFRKRNFGKSATLFEEALKVAPSADIYYYLAISCQEMKEEERALATLQRGVASFPRDANLWKSLAMLAYERGENDTARRALDEALRLSPNDRQSRFLRERLGEGEKRPERR